MTSKKFPHEGEVHIGNFVAWNKKAIRVTHTNLFSLYKFYPLKLSESKLDKFKLEKTGKDYFLGAVGLISKEGDDWVLFMPHLSVPIKGIHHLQNLHLALLGEPLCLKEGETLESIWD